MLTLIILLGGECYERGKVAFCENEKTHDGPRGSRVTITCIRFIKSKAYFHLIFINIVKIWCFWERTNKYDQFPL